MWMTPERPGADADSGPMDQAGTGAGRLFHRQPTCQWWPDGTDGAGRARWILDRPAAGVQLISLQALPVVVSLPGGIEVELCRELVPEARRLGIGGNATFPLWIDVALVLRMRRAGVIVQETRRQFEVFGTGAVSMNLPQTAQNFALSAGLQVDEEGNLLAYAHAWDLPVGEGLALESSPSIPDATLYGRRRAGPFGRGLSVWNAADETAPVGPIRLVADANDYAATMPARAWFAHATPLERRIALVPDGTPITARPADRIAWGRHRSAIYALPLAWMLGAMESEGHPEWAAGADSYVHHPGVSRLFDSGRPAGLVPQDWAGRSNVSPQPETNERLALVHGTWTDGAGWTTGNRNLSNVYRAWNEYHPPGAGWQDASGTFGGETITGAFLAVAIQRVDATNLGGITDQADAVQVSRIVLRWFAAMRTTSTAFGVTTNGYQFSTRSAVLSADDGASLLAGNAITVADAYTQGTYPATTNPNLYGTLTLQAGW